MGKFIIWKVNASCCLGRILRGSRGKSIKIEVQAKCGEGAPKGKESKVSITFLGHAFWTYLEGNDIIGLYSLFWVGTTV